MGGGGGDAGSMSLATGREVSGATRCVCDQEAGLSQGREWIKSHCQGQGC